MLLRINFTENYTVCDRNNLKNTEKNKKNISWKVMFNLQKLWSGKVRKMEGCKVGIWGVDRNDFLG